MTNINELYSASFEQCTFLLGTGGNYLNIPLVLS